LYRQNKLLRKELGYNFLPWINDRKLIYEAQPDKVKIIMTYFSYTLYHRLTITSILFLLVWLDLICYTNSGKEMPLTPLWLLFLLLLLSVNLAQF